MKQKHLTLEQRENIKNILKENINFTETEKRLKTIELLHQKKF